MELDIVELKSKVDDYFAKVTDEQLHQDLIESGSEVYSKIDLDILDEQEAFSPKKLELENDANSEYLKMRESIRNNIYVTTQEANRPTYPSKKRNVESSNQESNKLSLVKNFFLESAVEDCLLWRDTYGHL